MPIVLPTHGQSLWDNPLDLALRHLASANFLPNDHGYLNWSQDPATCNGSSNPAAGNVRMVKFPALPQSYTISTLTVFVAAAGVALTVGQNFGGLYDAAGVRVAVTADQSAVWNTTGLKNMALTVPYVVPSGANVWGAIVYNGTSMSVSGTTAVSGQGDLINANLTAANYRYTNNPTAQTSLPANVTMGTRITTPQATWMAAG